MAQQPLLPVEEWLRQISELPTHSEDVQSKAVKAMAVVLSKECDHRDIQRAMGQFELELSISRQFDNTDSNRDLAHSILDGLPFVLTELAGERNRVKELEEIIRMKETEERNRVKETRELEVKIDSKCDAVLHILDGLLIPNESSVIPGYDENFAPGLYGDEMNAREDGMLNGFGYSVIRDPINAEYGSQSVGDMSPSNIPYMQLGNSVVREENEKEKAVDGCSDTPKDSSQIDESARKRRQSRTISKPARYAEYADESNEAAEAPAKKSRSENNVETPQCVLCDKHPISAFNYMGHLHHVHKKSTLLSNGIFLRCSCGYEYTSRNRSAGDHGRKCHGLSFTLHKIDKE